MEDSFCFAELEAAEVGLGLLVLPEGPEKMEDFSDFDFVDLVLELSCEEDLLRFG